VASVYQIKETPIMPTPFFTSYSSTKMWLQSDSKEVSNGARTSPWGPVGWVPVVHARDGTAMLVASNATYKLHLELHKKNTKRTPSSHHKKWKYSMHLDCPIGSNVLVLGREPMLLELDEALAPEKVSTSILTGLSLLVRDGGDAAVH
jgi:hypothetical protein